MDSVERSNRTWLCTVVFLDIVAYTKRSVSQQSAMKERLNAFITEAMQHVSPNDRIILDTGDGAALCFMGDPEHALFAALHLRDSLRAQPHQNPLSLKVRIGVNVGPARIVHDINGQLNIIGDGINTAQRVMGFADANQILVSRSFYEVISCLSHEYAQLFHYQGVRTDKHIREHAVYEMMLAPDATSAVKEQVGNAVQAPIDRSSMRQATHQREWTSELLQKAQRELAKHIGPLAGMLVKKASRQASNAQQLYHLLGDHIEEESYKRQFLQAMGLNTAWTPSGAAGDDAAPDGVQAAQQIPRTWPSQMLQQAEERLATFIGPLAKVLVQREARRAVSIAELYRALAGHLALQEEKDQFLLHAPLSPYDC